MKMYSLLITALLFIKANTAILSNITVSLPNRMTMAVSAGLAHLTIIAPLTDFSDFQVIIYNLTTNTFITLGPPLDTGDWEIKEIKGLNTLAYNCYLTIGYNGWHSFNNFTSPKSQYFAGTISYLCFGRD